MRLRRHLALGGIVVALVWQVGTAAAVENRTAAHVSIANMPSVNAVVGATFLPVVNAIGSGSTSVISLTPMVCQIQAGVVTYLGAGTCTLVAHEEGSDSTPAVTGEPQSITVSQRRAVVGPDAGVSAVSISADGTAYVAGGFSQWGIKTAGLKVSVDDAAVDYSMPNVDDVVFAAVSDENGGFFIGGQFTAVGGVPRRAVAHIRADGSVDDVWAPEVDGVVSAIAVDGPTMYLGGRFRDANDLVRGGIVAVDRLTGALKSDWKTDVDSAVFAQDATICAIAVKDSRVFVGANFSFDTGVPREGAIALDAATGDLIQSWRARPNGSVHSIVVAGSRVFLGGAFDAVGGVSRTAVAVVDATTGDVDAGWNPAVDGSVFSIVVAESRVFLGGAFGAVGGVSRTGVAAVDATTGDVAETWQVRVDGDVRSLAASGETLYLGGVFSIADGVVRKGIAAIRADGTLSEWYPDSKVLSAWPPVYAIAVSGGNVFIAGLLFVGSQEARSQVASVDAATGKSLNWSVPVNGDVATMKVSQSRLYLAGRFFSVGGKPRSHVAAIDTGTGAVLDWKPTVGGGYDAEVSALAVDGATVFIGGKFSSVGGERRNNVAAVDDRGTVVPWDPDVNGRVSSLAIANVSRPSFQSRVYIGGTFSSVGGKERKGAAAVLNSASIATVLDWNPNLSGLYASVYEIAWSPWTVYLTGKFSWAGGQKVPGVVAVDDRTGAVSTWMPDTGFCTALALFDKAVYLGTWGNFTITAARAPTVPSSPTGVKATFAGVTALVKWDSPVDSGGALIDGYTATSSPGGKNCTVIGLWCNIDGLARGTVYSFTVTAKNSVGSSSSSDAFSALVPVTAPSSPTALVATAGRASANVSWQAPVDDGGSPITGYTVTASPGDQSCATDGKTTCIITGLVNGTGYTFTVKATNLAGESPASDASAVVTPTAPPAVPSAPAQLKVSGFAVKSASFTWRAAVANGSTVTRYEYSWRLQGVKTFGAWTACGQFPKATVKGWLKGRTYEFRVRAVNSVGFGPASKPLLVKQGK
ncbi:MAG: fibronectin type III domain-containing protein [Actinomycetales bacterium]|nr:fibronectin type III domain-containing protein [Actinomycetales bacterium]